MDMEAIVNNIVDRAREEAFRNGVEVDWNGNALLIGDFKKQEDEPRVWVELVEVSATGSNEYWATLSGHGTVVGAYNLEEIKDLSEL